MRYICAYALGKFAEALIDYLENLDRAPDKNVNAEDYLQSFNTACNILASWLQTAKEAKLRAAVMEALGFVALLSAQDQVEVHLQPVITNHLIPALKKQSDLTLPATQCLAKLIDSCGKNGSILLDSLVENIMSVMIVQLNDHADFSNAVVLKTQNEILRCFTLLCFCASSLVVNFLLAKLEPKAPSDSKTKAKVLSIFRHLVNTADEKIGDKRATILVSLREVVNDSDDVVARALLQLIISMADKGYLELEGSRILVEYVVQQCASCTPKPGTKLRPEQQAVARLASSVLNLLTTTLPQVESALWPCLLEYMLPLKYSQAFGSICKSLSFIAQRKVDNNDEISVDFANLPDVPKPVEIFGRCLLMAADEKEINSVGIHVVKFMQVFAPNFFPESKLSDDWESSLNTCLSLAEQDGDDEVKDFKMQWEKSLFKILMAAMNMTSDQSNDEWISQLATALFNQIDSYKNYPKSRCFFHLVIAACISRLVKRDNITKNVDNWFANVDHSSTDEQQAFGVGCGFAASTHLDVVLNKIEAGLKGQSLQNNPAPQEQKSGNAFINFFKDLTKSESGPTDKVKATLLLCMGNAVAEASHSLAVSRVESIVVPNLLQSSNNSTKPHQDIAIRLSILNCIEIVAKAFSPESLGKVVNLSKRDDLSAVIIKFAGDEQPANVESKIRIQAIKAATSLITLEPLMPDQRLEPLTSSLIKSVFSLPQTASEEPMFLQAMEALNEYFTTIFSKHQEPVAAIVFLLKHLSDDKWLQSNDDCVRERSAEMIANVTRTFKDKMLEGAFVHSNQENRDPFKLVSNIFTIIIPRLADSVKAIRKYASEALIDSVEALLHMTGKELDMNEAGKSLKDRVVNGEANVLHSAILDVAKLLNKLLVDVKPLVTSLNLSDCQPHGSAASCLVLHTLIKLRSNELVDIIPEMFEKFLKELAKIVDGPVESKSTGSKKRSNSINEELHAPSSTGPVQTGILRCCRLFAQLQTSPTMNTLLSISYPYPESVSVIWRYMAQDNQLAGTILEMFLDKLSRAEPYKEAKQKPMISPGQENHVSGRYRPIRTAHSQPLLVLAALSDMFTVPEMEGKLMANYHQIFAILILFISALAGAKDVVKEEGKEVKATKNGNGLKATPVSQALVCLNNFLNSASSSDVRGMVDDVWPDFAKDDTVLEAIAKLAKILGKSRSKQMVKVSHALLPYFTSPYDTYRSAVASCFAEFIAQSEPEDELIETLISSLQGHLTDQCFDVRLYCFRGMGNFGVKGEKIVDKHATSLLNCLLVGLDDKDDPDGEISLEVLKSMEKLLSSCSEETVRPIFVNISVRVKVCFDRDDALIRAASIRLFASLMKFSSGQSEIPVWEQAHLALIPIWVHLNDKDEDVSLASAEALLSLGPVLGAADVDKLFTKALKHYVEQGSTSSLHFNEFSRKLAIALAEYFADSKFSYYTQLATGYFKSTKPDIRANGVIILGNFFKFLHFSFSMAIFYV